MTRRGGSLVTALKAMNLAELFIRRPVMTTLVMLGILLFGVMAYTYLPVNDLPNVDYPTIQVMASLPGASPETMASAVATPLIMDMRWAMSVSAYSFTVEAGSVSEYTAI